MNRGFTVAGEMTFLLLPSPFLPARVYRPLADALGRAGASAQVLEVGEPTSPELVTEGWRQAALAVEKPSALVAHSNAGLLAPLVRFRVGKSLIPIVFLDAALLPDTGSTNMAPAPLRAQMARLVDGQGILPPWTRWWPPGAPVTAPPRWTELPCAYFALGNTYQEVANRARRLGWPTEVHPTGTHLHFLWEPDSIAHRLITLTRLTSD